MAQLTIIDEDELQQLRTDAVWCDLYRDLLQKCQNKLFPGYISVDPVSSYEYDYDILMEMYFEIYNKRKPWWKRLCVF